MGPRRDESRRLLLQEVDLLDPRDGSVRERWDVLIDGPWIEAIAPAKDVDGFHFINIGKLTSGNTADAFVPCTPAGCMRLLEEAGVEYERVLTDVRNPKSTSAEFRAASPMRKAISRESVGSLIPVPGFSYAIRPTME